jgi:tetratricopeptide (TPR) repeat protein
MDITEKYMALAEAERWSEALPVIEEIVADSPDISTSWLNYGVCLSALGREREAADRFLKAYELSPEDYGAQYRAFLSLFRAQDYEAFLALARRECQEMPEMIETLVEDEDFGTLFTRPEFQQLQQEFAE